MLSSVWDTLDGSSETSMAAYKLDRAEDLRWEPPQLKFKMARHGAASSGSKRAEMQEWSIDLDRRTASLNQLGHRQLVPNAARLNVKPIVALIIEAVRLDKPHSAVVRDGDLIRIKQSIAIPSDGPKQTIADRRRRFADEASRQMAALGYELVGKTPSLKYKKAGNLGNE